MDQKNRSFVILFFGVLALLFTGCQVTPTPPLFPLFDHKGVILLPFDNLSQDGALAQEVQDGVTAQLVALKAAPIFEEGPVADYLNGLKAGTDPTANATVRQKLAKRFKGDLLMSCNVENYTESIQDNPPQRMMVDYKAKTYKWGYYTVQQVKVTAAAKLIDVASGNIAWMKQAFGVGQMQTWNDLSYPGDKDAAPGEGWDTYMRHQKEGPEKDRWNKEHDGDKGRNDHNDGHLKGNDRDRRDNRKGNTVVNININNSPEETTGVPPAPLYQTNATIANLRQAAIARTVTWLTDDFKGHGGWYPGYVAPPKK